MCLSASDTVPRQVFRSSEYGKENVDLLELILAYKEPSFMNLLLLERKQQWNASLFWFKLCRIQTPATYQIPYFCSIKYSLASSRVEMVERRVH